MSHLATTDTLFFERAGLDKHRTEKLVDDALKGADDGELFLEYTQSESLAFDDGRLKSASYDTMQGFGLRSVAGEAAGYAHSNELSEDAIKRAAGTVGAVHQGRSGVIAEPPIGTNRVLYGDDNPLNDVAFEDKVNLLAEIDGLSETREPGSSRLPRSSKMTFSHGSRSRKSESSRRCARSSTWSRQAATMHIRRSAFWSTTQRLISSPRRAMNGVLEGHRKHRTGTAGRMEFTESGE